jgi:integrase
MPSLIEMALEAKRKHVKPGTLKLYEGAGRKLSEIMQEFSPEEVTHRDIVQIKRALSETPGMANHCLTVLRIVFAYAVENDLLDNNPAIGIDRVRQAARDRLLTADEYRRIHAKASPKLQVTMDLCFLTGQRIGDVLNIRYTDITDAGIAFKQAKTGAKLLVSWTPELRAVVDRAKALHGNVRAFTLLHGHKGKPPTYWAVRDAWDRAVAASGVKDAHIHDIRAMSATAAEEAGINATALLGHTSPQMTKRYLRSKKVPVVQGPSFGQVSKKAS